MVPPVTTTAQGQVFFYLNESGSEIRYRVTVSNIENVIQANIYLGREGQDGQALVTIFPENGGLTEVRGPTTGLLVESVITQADLGGGLQMNELVANMRGGFTHVKIRTTQNQQGEIRGQIK